MSGDTEARIKNIIVELLGVDEGKVTREARFREDLEADSLDLVELIMEFENEFGGIMPLEILIDTKKKKGVMNLSVNDVEGDILVVSQFTLHASTKKGNRPSYIKAASPDIAIPLYNAFIDQMKQDLGNNVITGEFGAYMQVSLTNDGPVTLWIDTKNKE